MDFNNTITHEIKSTVKSEIHEQVTEIILFNNKDDPFELNCQQALSYIIAGNQKYQEDNSMALIQSQTRIQEAIEHLIKVSNIIDKKLKE